MYTIESPVYGVTHQDRFLWSIEWSISHQIDMLNSFSYLSRVFRIVSDIQLSVELILCILKSPQDYNNTLQSSPVSIEYLVFYLLSP